MTEAFTQSRNKNQIAELTTPANAGDLNEALAKEGVSTSSIIAVFLIEGTKIADGAGDMYRVLYKAAS
jgi:hypothetical protein